MTKHDSTGRRPAAMMAQGLGWFSIGLGVAELLGAQRLAHALGMPERAGLLRAYGMRGIVTGIGILAGGRQAPWLWGRVGGDLLDLVTLAPALGPDNPRRTTAAVATAAVAGTAAADFACARAIARQERRPALVYDYSDRRGFPRPAEMMRGAARDAAKWRPVKTPGSSAASLGG